MKTVATQTDTQPLCKSDDEQIIDEGDYCAPWSSAGFFERFRENIYAEIGSRCRTENQQRRLHILDNEANETRLFSNCYLASAQECHLLSENGKNRLDSELQFGDVLDNVINEKRLSLIQRKTKKSKKKKQKDQTTSVENKDCSPRAATRDIWRTTQFSGHQADNDGGFRELLRDLQEVKLETRVTAPPVNVCQSNRTTKENRDCKSTKRRQSQQTLAIASQPAGKGTEQVVGELFRRGVPKMGTRVQHKGGESGLAGLAKIAERGKLGEDDVESWLSSTGKKGHKSKSKDNNLGVVKSSYRRRDNGVEQKEVNRLNVKVVKNSAKENISSVIYSDAPSSVPGKKLAATGQFPVISLLSGDSENFGPAISERENFTIETVKTAGMKWVVKRRSDGTRYITKRPATCRQQSQSVAKTTNGATSNQTRVFRKTPNLLATKNSSFGNFRKHQYGGSTTTMTTTTSTTITKKTCRSGHYCALVKTSDRKHQYRRLVNRNMKMNDIVCQESQSDNLLNIL